MEGPRRAQEGSDPYISAEGPLQPCAHPSHAITYRSVSYNMHEFPMLCLRGLLCRCAHLSSELVQMAQAAHGAAMAIAKVSRIEILGNQWPDLLEHIHGCIAQESPENTRVYGLQCLGYICEEHSDVADQFPQQETNRVLTSIVGGMSGNQPIEVKLYATKALCDALEFASMNFEKQDERDCLMQMICEAAVSPDARIRLAAYQNLNKVADLHYKYLEPYIAMIYPLTTQCFLDVDDEVAMQVRSRAWMGHRKCSQGQEGCGAA